MSTKNIKKNRTTIRRHREEIEVLIREERRLF